MLDLTVYAKSGYSLLYVETLEIKRAMSKIRVNEEFTLHKWNMIEGLIGVEEGDEYKDFESLFKMLSDQKETIVVMENLDFFFQSETLVQLILNSMKSLKSNQNMIVIVGAGGNNQQTIPGMTSEGGTNFPPALQKIITRIEFPLPSKEEFREVAKELCELVGIEYKEDVADCCMGLSLEEGENALSKSIIENKALDRNTVLEMKRNMIKSTGFMDFLEPEPVTNLGGLGKWKEYILKRLEAWKNPESNKPKLKSMLCIGIQGAGKTLSAKVLASIFKWPCIILDINALKGSFVGETERRTRLATKIIDAFGQCIIVIDK